MFQGSIVALITPFINNQLDEPALRKLVDWHVDQGTDAIVAVGTTGESPTLSHAEHKRVVAVCVEQSDGRIAIIAGAGSNNPAEAIELSQHAEKAGAVATLHVAGYYNRPSQDGLFAHFEALHEKSQLPIIIYNIPPRATVDILPETLARIAALPRVIGVKDATGDLTRPWQERQLIEKEFCYLSGNDMTAVSYNVAGGHGCISVTANVAPALCAKMQQACLQGDYRTAKELQDQMVSLHDALFTEPSPAGVKYAVSLLGLAREEARLPVLPLSQDSKTRIKHVMTELGLLS